MAIKKTIKTTIKAKQEEKKRARATVAYEKYFAKANILLGPDYKNSAESIIANAKVLEQDVKNGAIKSILDYDDRYYDLAQDIKALYAIKQEEEILYIDTICSKGLDQEQQANISVTHSEVSKYLNDNLSRAMTATRNCEFARMGSSLGEGSPLPTNRK